MSLVNDFKLHQDLHLQALDNVHSGVPEGLPGQLQELAPTVAAFETAKLKIEADANLTAIGRQNALQAERDKATATIDTWKTGKVTGIDAQMAAQESTLQSQADKATPAPTEFQVLHMASKLSALDPLEIAVLYSDASESERLTIEKSVEQIGRTPRRRADGQVVWETLLPAERIEQARAARLERANPEAVTALRDLARVKNTYLAMSTAATSLLGK